MIKQKVFLGLLLLFFSYNLRMPAAFAFTEIDPCKFFSKLPIEHTSKDAFKTTFKKFISDLVNFSSKPLINEFNIEEELYFTIDRGYSMILNCNQENPSVKLARSIFYPVGLVVLPISSYEFSSPEGEPEFYYYTITENGIGVFIKKDDLRKMEKDEIYLFANGASPVPYCAGEPKCTYNEVRNIDARSTYAKFKEPASDILDRLNQYDCGPYEIIPYYDHGKETKEVGAKIKFCDIEKIRNGNLIHKTYEKMKEIFSFGVRGYLHRFVSSSIEKYIPFVISKKECNQKITDDKFLSIGGSFNGKLEFAHFGGGIGTETRFERTITKELELGTYYIFLSYIANTRFYSDKTAIYDLIIVSKCEGTTPTEVTNIDIYIGSSENNKIPLLGNEIQKEYKDNFEPGLLWLKPRVDKEKFQGKFWLIAGYDQYVRWRDFLRRKIYLNLSSEFPKNMETEKRKVISDFYAHIVLAASFDYLTDDEAEAFKNIMSNWK